MTDPIAAWPAEPHGWIRDTENRAFPSRFHVRTAMDGYTVEMLAEVGPRGPAAAEVTVRQPAGRNGPPVTMTVLRRVAVDHVLRAAVDQLSRPATSDDSEPGAFRVEGIDGLWHGLASPEGGRGSQTTDDRLHQVAQIYRAALAAGKPPVNSVQEQLHFSRSTAGRLVGQARKAGLLPPTTRGRRGTLTDLVRLAQRLEDAGGEVSFAAAPPEGPQPEPELPPRTISLAGSSTPPKPRAQHQQGAGPDNGEDSE